MGKPTGRKGSRVISCKNNIVIKKVTGRGGI